MFEFAAGQVQQKERERQIAEGLRRRELLATARSGRGDESEFRQRTTMPRRAQAPARANAER
jgi:hypothetical protein